MIGLLVLLVVCYLLGSFPSGAVVAKIMGGANPSEAGSGSTGASNTYRVIGLKAAAIVLFLDVMKGFAAACLAYLVFVPGFISPFVKFAFGLAAVIGHNWPVFLGFKGGKGVAATCGVFLAICPSAVGTGVLLWLGVALLTRWASAASLTVSFAFPFLIYAYGGSVCEIIFSAVTAALIFWRHSDNIRRLMAGTEDRLEIKFFK